MAFAQIFIFALIGTAAASAANLESSDSVAINPIRKVVNMLQVLQKKVTAEGEKEAALYEKFKCYCSNSGSSLSKSISDAEKKVSREASDIEAGEAQNKQDTESLHRAEADRADARSSMQKATAIRNKDAAAFAAEHAESSANLAALTGAITAIEKGITGFLQTAGAQRVRRTVLSDKDVSDFDRDEVISFLSGAHGAGYVPQSGQIVGVLKNIKDGMSQSHADMETAEATAVASYEELMAAKTKQAKVLTESIESLNVRLGDASLQIAQMKEDLDDTQAALDQDKQFHANMDHDCATKASEYDANVKTRSEELLAISDTIKLLSDDDALELFKRTLPSSSSSFLQMQFEHTALRARALGKVLEAMQKAPQSNPGLDFIALALQSKNKKVDFGKVIKMVDGLVATLQREQVDDNNKHAFCEKRFDSADDKMKGLQRLVSDLDSSITKDKDALATLQEEISTLEDGIKALDKEVAEATEQRKEENKDFTELLASNTAAKRVLGVAKDRMNQFYHPNRVPTETASLVQIKQHRQLQTEGAYSTKEHDSSDVLAMIDVLIKDVEKEIVEAQTTEKDSEADYDRAMNNAREKRTLDTKTLTDKAAAKASVEAEVQGSQKEKGNAAQEIMTTDKFISALHGECDFLLQYFDTRKEARDGEIASLKTAKSVLLGADISLVQEGRSLRGVA